jgi:L-iditol 2-dehydrogenase
VVRDRKVGREVRAAYTKVPFQFEIHDDPIIKPGPKDVLVRIRACGVCGTDLHTARVVAGDWCGVGHEIAGEVAEVGSAVTRVKPGQSVIVENCTFCGVCEQCQNGLTYLCSNASSMAGQVGAAEYITINEMALVAFDGLSYIHATISEPLTVALDVAGLADIPLNSTVCVMGPGPIGLMCVKLAKLHGAKSVILVGNSHSTAGLAVGRELGADEVVLADKVDVAERIKELAPKGVDRVIVTSPPQTIPSAIRIANFGAIIAFIGIDFGGGDVVSLSINEIHFKRLQIRASHAIPNLMFPVALDMLKRKVIDPEKIVTHVFPLDRAGHALRETEDNKADVIKTVIDCS